MLVGTQNHFLEENLQLVEIVEAEAQMFNSDQIQQEIVLWSYIWFVFVDYSFFYVNKKENVPLCSNCKGHL